MAILSPCVDSFILTILCGNPILKGSFITLLSSIVLQLDAEVTDLNAQLGRLNVINQVLNFEIQAVQAIIDKVQADFNLILGPLQQFGSCPELAQLSQTLQESAISKKFAGLQEKIYWLNRRANIANVQNSISQHKDETRNNFLAFIDRINTLCP
jgi:hypothetical protein